MKTWQPLILVMTALGFLSACTHHAVAPPKPASASPVHSSLADQSWKLAPLQFDGKTRKDSPEDIQALEDRFKDYLEARLVLGPESAQPDLVFELQLQAKRNHYRTLIMDLMNVPFVPLVIGGFFNPEWGTARVAGQLKIYGHDRELLSRHIARADEDFWILIYSWYRSQPIEDAFATSYARVFNDLLEQVAKKNIPHAAPKPPLRTQSDSSLNTFLLDPALVDPLLTNTPTKGRAPIRRPVLLSNQPPDPRVSLLDEENHEAPPKTAAPEKNNDPFKIIWEPNPIVYESHLMRGLQALGGFEAAYFTGEATVTSSINQADGSSIEVANGRAQHQGYRITLYDVPETTGFYWYPVVGFLDQSIDITDFYEDVPQLGATVGTDIDADCTLLSDDGQSVIPCGLPNTYSLDMQSIVAGLRMGFSVVAGTSNAQIFFTGTAGGNLMEWRSITASLGDIGQGTREKVDFIQSAAFGSTLGLFFPKLHFSIRGMFNYEIYQAFQFDQPIEFMGPTVCDFDIGRCERQRAFVESTSLKSWTMQVAAGVSF